MKNKFRTNILYIGHGNMGQQVAKQLECGLFFARKFILNSKQNGALTAKNAKIKLDILCIFTKPQDTAKILQQHNEILAEILTKNTVVISIMAGKDYNFVNQYLPKIEGGSLKYIRYMPNIGIKSSLGVGSVYFKNVDEDCKRFIVKALSKKSQIIEVDCEEKINALTACFGSGIAFAAKIMQYFTESTNEFLRQNNITIKNEILQQCVANLFVSGIKEVSKLAEPNYNNFIDKICSKGGTTIAGLDFLNSQNLTTQFYNVFQASLNRAVELKNTNNDSKIIK